MTRFERGFTRAKVSTIMGHTELRYTQNQPEGTDNPAPFTVVASPKGVQIYGRLLEPLTDPDDMRGLADIIGQSYQMYLQLKPKIITNPKEQ